MGNVVSTGLQLVGTASSPRLDQRLASAIKRTVELANSQDITPRERLHVKAMELFSQGWDPEAGCRSPNSWPFCPSIKKNKHLILFHRFQTFSNAKTCSVKSLQSGHLQSVSIRRGTGDVCTIIRSCRTIWAVLACSQATLMRKRGVLFTLEERCSLLMEDYRMHLSLWQH